MLSTSLTALAALLVLAQPGEVDRYAPSASPGGDLVLERCIVMVQDDIQLPAQEPGVLVHLAVQEGARVTADQEIGQIDDTDPQMQKEIARYAYAAAWKRATEDIEITFQKAAADVAEAELDAMEEANRRRDGVFSASDIRKARLEHTKATLGIEKTQHDQQLARWDAATRRAELRAAEVAIERRRIVAPFDGVVLKLFRRQDEWVSPGDPILRLVRLDTMNVEGTVDYRQHDPHEIDGCRATIEVEMARGRKVSLPGRITMVSPLIDGRDRYNVRAEITNRQEGGQWLLRDGLLATMTVHLGTAGAEPTARREP